MNRKIPMFFFNSSEENREAIRELNSAGIKYEIYGPLSNQRIPFLTHNSIDYIGLNGIKIFIDKWKNGTLKDSDE
ncbi:MAG: hypothetical protein ACFFDT_25150 [Candidatus Hodarchaeota archaeon]